MTCCDRSGASGVGHAAAAGRRQPVLRQGPTSLSLTHTSITHTRHSSIRQPHARKHSFHKVPIYTHLKPLKMLVQSCGCVVLAPLLTCRSTNAIADVFFFSIERVLFSICARPILFRPKTRSNGALFSIAYTTSRLFNFMWISVARALVCGVLGACFGVGGVGSVLCSRPQYPRHQSTHASR